MPLSDPPALQPLQRLHHLDRVSSDFHDQLHVVLSEERYAECEQRLDDDDLMWLLKYLDEVRPQIALPALRSNWCRLSTTLIIPVRLTRNANTNSEAYAGRGRNFRHHTRSYPTFSALIPSHSLQDLMAMCTRGPLTVQKFA